MSMFSRVKTKTAASSEPVNNSLSDRPSPSVKYNIHAIMQGTVIVIGSQSQPPTAVTIDGPVDGVIDTAHTFTANIEPVTAAQPITYVWQATGQSDVAHLGGISDTIVFTWTSGTTGTQLITATATNDSGSSLGTHVIIFGASKIYLPLIRR